MGRKGLTLEVLSGSRREDRERPVLRPAVGLDKGSGSRAETGTADRIRHQRNQSIAELAFAANANGGGIGEEGVRNLRKVVHVRAEHDRFAEDRGLENVVPTGGTRLPPTKATVAS